MREIKFRAWDGNKMLHDITQWFVSESSNKYHLLDGYPLIELMQFTGLKDKNGKGIYEGDIVKLTEDFLFREFELCVIEYHKYGIPYIVQRYLINKEGTGDYNFDYLKNSSISGRDSYYEIIGNIYENPELLSSGQKVQASVATTDAQ